MLLTRARAGTGVRGGIPTPPSPREADLGHPLAALACVLAAARGSGAWLRRGGREEVGGAQLTRMRRVGGGPGRGTSEQGKPEGLQNPFGFGPFILKYNGISLINGSYGFCQNRIVPR
jgi:hypothetical protein